MSNVIQFQPKSAPTAVEVANESIANREDTLNQDGAFSGKDMFKVTEHKMFADVEGEKVFIPKRKIIMVEDKYVNNVSDSYEIHQPAEIYNRFEEVATTHGLQINKVITNPNNGGLLIGAKFESLKIGNEDHDVNLTFYTSHCGRYKTFLALNTLRMACFNQVPALYRGKNRFIFSEKHYKNALNIELIGKTLEQIPASIDVYCQEVQELQNMQFSFDDFVAFYSEYYKIDKKMKSFDRKMEELKENYFGAPGQDIAAPNSAWKAFNTVSYLNTHNGRNTIYQNEQVLLAKGNDTLKFKEKLLAVS